MLNLLSVQEGRFNLLLRRFGRAAGVVDKAEAAIVDIGEVGRTRALELGAKGLFKGRVQKGELRVGQVGSDGSDGIVIGRTVWISSKVR
jgi:hypothetical protein